MAAGRGVGRREGLRVHAGALADGRRIAALRGQPLPRLARSGPVVQGRRAHLARGTGRRDGPPGRRLRPQAVPHRGPQPRVARPRSLEVGARPAVTIRLSREDARRVAVRAQLLDARRDLSVAEVVEELTLLQVDPTAAIAPSTDLVLWSRLGEHYEHSDLTFALETERSVVELSSYVRPMDDIGLLLATAPQELHPTALAWLGANDGFRADVLARLAGEGPLTAPEIPDTCQAPWTSSGWNDDRSVNRLLEVL